MNQKFKARGFFTVPDGTEVSPFLNATDINQTDVPLGLLGEMSIAAGRVGPGVWSVIHMHPVVTQVTYVLAGLLTVRMKDDDSAHFYDVRLNAGQAVVTRPATLFQLRNDGTATAEVLYIASPSYVFELEAGVVVYDDAFLVPRSWDELEACNYDVPELKLSASEVNARRAEAKRRIATVKALSRT